MTINALRTPDDRFDNLPGWTYAPKYVEGLPGYDGLRMHYVDEGPADADVTFLCIHGEPSWAYLFRKMIPVFTSAGHRAIAVDMFGFGRSDKPTNDNVYTYHFHRNALLAFVERLDLKNVCLVVQDWGGLLGLTLPMEAPDRYTRLIVMNTGLPGGEEANEGFSAWRAYNRSQPDLDVGGLMGRTTSILSEAEKAAYDAPFPSQDYKGGVRRFPELVMLKEKGADDLTPSSKEGVETSLKARKFWSEKWTGESFMAIGMQDPVLGPPAMHFLRSLIKNCPEPMEVADAGHFVQEWGEPIAAAGLDRFGLK
ncbi:MAG: haloalkane dehalogenase [Pseudomonadota bacterium]